MPCNIGYKSYAPIAIPEPQPQAFKSKAEAPEIDADLLEKLGEEDAEFLEWAKELDPRQLLSAALKRTLAKVTTGGLAFTINANGMLEAEGSFIGASAERRLAAAASDVSERWQFELLGIVAEILGYTATITQRGDEFVLEAEEEGKAHPCDFIKITKKGNESSIAFEHFKSRNALKSATAKFLTLAHALGVKIALGESEISEGSPFPGEVRHDPIHAHGYRRDDHER